MSNQRRRGHIRLLTHPSRHGEQPLPVHWGAPDPAERGPLIGTLTNTAHRNVIGTHSGSYAIYRALAVASGALDPGHQPDLTDTRPTSDIGRHAGWTDPDRIVSIDPLGHLVGEVFREQLERGYNIQPTIAVTSAHLDLPEIKSAIAAGRLTPDGTVLRETGDCLVANSSDEGPPPLRSSAGRRFSKVLAPLRGSEGLSGSTSSARGSARRIREGDWGVVIHLNSARTVPGGRAPGGRPLG